MAHQPFFLPLIAEMHHNRAPHCASRLLEQMRLDVRQLALVVLGQLVVDDLRRNGSQSCVVVVDVVAVIMIKVKFVLPFTF